MAVNIRQTPPAVVVLIPVYNHQQALNRTCASLPEGASYDVVIVDDGSEPALVLPAELDPQRAKLIRLAVNGGITRALNAGLEWILGKSYKYIARLDAGDLMLAGRIERQVAFLDAHPDHVLVSGQVRFVDLQGSEVFGDRFPVSDGEIRRAMHGRSCFIHPAVMLRAAALRAVGSYDEHYPNAEDFELFWRLLRHGKGANLADVVVEYEINPAGLSLTKRGLQVRTRIRILLKYFDPLVPESYAGLMKNLMLLLVPYCWVTWAKRRLSKRARGWL